MACSQWADKRGSNTTKPREQKPCDTGKDPEWVLGTAGGMCRSRHEVESEFSCRSGDVQLDVRVALSLACIGHQCNALGLTATPSVERVGRGRAPGSWAREEAACCTLGLHLLMSEARGKRTLSHLYGTAPLGPELLFNQSCK